MNNTAIIQKALDLVESAAGSKISYEVFYTDATGVELPHEFLFFIKPEVTLIPDHTRMAAVLGLVFDRISEYGLHIKDIRLLSASYLEKFDIIAKHYGVINALSRQPLQFLSTEAKSRFSEWFGKRPDEVKLLGSLQFLQEYPSFSPDSLEQLWQKSRAFKLAGGAYCAVVPIQGEDIYLINGFHPRQLIQFTAKGRSIIAFTLAGDLDWSVARNQFIGKTNPADALPGSLRNDLLLRKEEFGLLSVSSSQNGFHLSAGPVEGLVELIRYCSDYSSGNLKKPDDFIFGKQLRADFSEADIDKICNNQFVDYQESRLSAFDLTEEKNSLDAIRLLKESRF
jgi:nucleoside diphosphate kinase